MRVAEVMSRGVEPMSATCTVQQAATVMAEMDVGAVLVGSEDALEGILTDRDIILRVVVDGRSPGEVTLGEVMSSRLFTCRPEDSAEDALREMRDRQVRRLPVCDDDGKLVGIVTLADLSRAGRDPSQLAQALRDVAEPHRNSHVVEDEEPGELSAVR